jgi:hypothetical protein
MLYMNGYYSTTISDGATTGDGEYLLNIPVGYRIDDVVMKAGFGSVLGTPVGFATLIIGTARGKGPVLAYDETRVKFTLSARPPFQEGVVTIGSAAETNLRNSPYSIHFEIAVAIKPA